MENVLISRLKCLPHVYIFILFQENALAICAINLLRATDNH